MDFLYCLPRKKLYEWEVAADRLWILETVEKVPVLLQLRGFAQGGVTPPRRILPIYAFVVVPCPVQNHAISRRTRLFQQFLIGAAMMKFASNGSVRQALPMPASADPDASASEDQAS